MNTSTKDTIDRALRTFLQAFTGVIVLQAGSIALDIGKGTYIPDLEWIKRVGFSAVAAGVISLVSFIHNASEQAGLPAILKPTDRAVGEAVLKGEPVVIPPVKP